MTKYRAIDADGHVMEHPGEIKEFLEPPYDRLPWTVYSLFPSVDGFVRGFSRLTEDDDPDAERWLEFLDRCGIETSYLYPSVGLTVGLIQDRDYAAVISRAYNRWIHSKFMQASERLRAVALIPVQNLPEAVTELRAAVTELGMPGAMLPSVTASGKHYGHRDYDPLYEEAQRLGCCLAIHGAVSQHIGIDNSDNLFKTITLEHPVSQLIQFTDMMTEGVFERFPDLRFAFLEAGAGWVPYMMDRMDENYERRGKRWCPMLTKRPSEYVRSGNIYVSCEVEEKTLPTALQLVGEDRIFFASDYPHERHKGEFYGDIDELNAREDLADSPQAQGPLRQRRAVLQRLRRAAGSRSRREEEHHHAEGLFTGSYRPDGPRHRAVQGLLP